MVRAEEMEMHTDNRKMALNVGKTLVFLVAVMLVLIWLANQMY